MMTTSWPLELALTWPLPHPPPKLSPLIGLPTQDFHVTVPFPRMFLPLQSLLISPVLAYCLLLREATPALLLLPLC